MFDIPFFFLSWKKNHRIDIVSIVVIIMLLVLLYSSVHDVLWYYVVPTNQHFRPLNRHGMENGNICGDIFINVFSIWSIVIHRLWAQFLLLKNSYYIKYRYPIYKLHICMHSPIVGVVLSGPSFEMTGDPCLPLLDMTFYKW